MTDKEIKVYEEKLVAINNLKNDIVQSIGYLKHVGSMLDELESLDIVSARRLRRQVLECFDKIDFSNLLDELETIKKQDEEKIDYENSIKLKYTRKENLNEKE